jgi:hypothetical protein
VKSMRDASRYPEDALADLLPADRGAGHDHQRPPRARCAAPQPPSFSPSGYPPAASLSSMAATSSRKRHRRSTPRSSSTRSKAQGCKSAERPHELIVR